MPIPKFSPLQSRFAASVGALLILAFVYFSLTRPQFAYALELDSRIPPDHNHPIIFETDGSEDEEKEILPDNSGSSAANKRQATEASELSNNTPLNKDIQYGATQLWLIGSKVLQAPPGVVGPGLPRETLDSKDRLHEHNELKKRQASTNLYITINICTQPASNTTSSNSTAPPQLILYYSRASENQQPGPSSSSTQEEVQLDGGYALINITTTENIYVSVASQNGDTAAGTWNYEIAASIDAPYHQVEEEIPYLHFVDADNHAALLITDDLTSADAKSSVYQEWMSLRPPYGMFAHDQRDPAILGLSKSYCGLMNEARVVANRAGVENQNVAGMTNRGVGAKPKEQFYITALNASSTYWGWLAMQGNSTAFGQGVVGGGGKVWQTISFNTKSESNCALMYNLTFCSEVAYAVPTNPDLFSPRTGYEALAGIYDSYASSMYQYFNYSLQQIPCKAPPTSQYSLARTCTDCANAYKSWLCAVTIPRCEDFTNTKPWLKARNAGQPWSNGTMLKPSTLDNQLLLDNVATNQSRNQIIDAEIKPGPYKEVLPCDDLCYDLVKSCPASLGFGCPQSRSGLEDSYGFRTTDDGEITCSYLGAAYFLGAAGRTIPSVHSGILFISVVLISAGFIL